MTTYLCRAVFVALALTSFSSPARGQVSELAQELSAIEDYNRRVADYVTLHRLLEGPLPPPQVSPDLREVRANMIILARQIMTARRAARQGDIITPVVAGVFQRQIAGCLKREAWEAILAENDEDSPKRLPTLRANAAWPDDAPFNFVPPQLLRVLPPLPPELQYRIIGRALVLWDHHANLVVDFLPGAFDFTT